MERRFEGRVGVVTGGAQGIGEAIVRRFHTEGGSVVVADRNEARLEELADELDDRFLGIPIDVRNEDHLAAMVVAAVDHFGALHVAFNVAGAAHYNAITDLTEAEWDFTLDICAKGVVFAMKHEARQMVAQKSGGAIVNIASLNSLMPLHGGAPYCAAKAAVAMVTQVGALELAAEGVRVNAVSPGLTATSMNEGLRSVPALNQAFLDRIPLGRSANPSDVAAASVWLASNDAAYVTGTNFVVDGGWALSGYPDFQKVMSQQSQG
jgi:NAD(P)-dependent dehydrogenase (short-subunit alcohol dehydrogenase family)